MVVDKATNYYYLGKGSWQSALRLSLGNGQRHIDNQSKQPTLKIFDLGESEHVAFLVVEGTAQIVEGDAGAQSDSNALHSDHADVGVVVLTSNMRTFLHISAMYLLCTTAALIPMMRLRTELSSIPMGA
jgi:hypothetical protein